MRYPAKHKAEIRERIVAEAARALREEGLDAVSVPRLMQRVGLTHGGFYNHFEDRDALVAEAVARAAAETGEGVFEAHEGDAEAVLATYLSPEHVASPGGGCVLAALGGEAAHADSPRVRRAFAAAARGFLAYAQRMISPTARRRLDDDALVVASQMIGAVVLARLVDDRALATRILASARRAAAR
jgi:TetR/AcrR family transcriptional repressor of nem operon